MQEALRSHDKLYRCREQAAPVLAEPEATWPRCLGMFRYSLARRDLTGPLHPHGIRQMQRRQGSISAHWPQSLGPNDDLLATLNVQYGLVSNVS